MTCVCIINELNFLQVFRFLHVTYTFFKKYVFNNKLIYWKCLFMRLFVNSVKNRELRPVFNICKTYGRQ